MRLSRGELLLFTDDDVVVPEDWVDKMVASFDRHDGAAVCGDIAPVAMRSDIERYSPLQGGGLARQTAGPIHAAPMMSFIVSREAFKKIGGFLDAPLRAAEDWGILPSPACQRRGYRFRSERGSAAQLPNGIGTGTTPHA